MLAVVVLLLLLAGIDVLVDVVLLHALLDLLLCHHVLTDKGRVAQHHARPPGVLLGLGARSLIN